MKRVVNEVTHTTVNKLDLRKTYCAIYGDSKFLYKLHCVDGDYMCNLWRLQVSLQIALC